MARTRGLEMDETVEENRDPIVGINEEIDANILAEFGRAENDVSWKITVKEVPTNADGTAKKSEETNLFETDHTGYDSIKQKLFDHYGPGLYRIRIWKNEGRGFVLRGREDYRLKVPFGWKPKPIGEMTEKPNQTPDATLLLVQAIREEMRETRDELRALRQVPVPVPAAQSDTIALVRSIMDLTRTMQPPAPAQAPADAVFTAFSKGMEMALEIGNRGTEPSMAGMAMKALETIGPALLAGMANKQTPVTLPTPEQRPPEYGFGGRPEPLPENPPEQAPPNANENQQQNEINATQRLLFERVSFLAGVANRLPKGNSPDEIEFRKDRAEFYAEWMLDSMPPELSNYLLQQPNAIDIACQMVPNLAPHRQWAGEVLGSMRQFVSDERQASGDPQSAANDNAYGSAGRPTGNAGNTQENVGTDPGSQEKS